MNMDNTTSTLAALRSELETCRQVEDMNNETIHSLQSTMKYLEGQLAAYEHMLDIIFGGSHETR